MSGFSAVIFDMDGLLFDSEPVYRDSWQESARELGHELTDQMYLGLIGRRIALCEAELGERFGAGFSVPRFRELWKARWHQRVTSRGVELKPGASEFLDFVERRGLPRAIATSSAGPEARLVLGELASRFGAIVTGDQVANGKPAPDIYLAAARSLAVDPSRCLVLEDSEPGATAARAAGMACIIVPDLKQPSPEVAAGALRVCVSLHEALELVQGMV